MLQYQQGPTKTLQNGAADTLLWEQGSIPSGSQVKAVSFVYTGTGHTLSDTATIKLMRGGTIFMSFASNLQQSALVDSLGKKTVANTAQRFTIPIQNTFGWPYQYPFLAAPPNEALSIEIVTSTGSSATGTIIPYFHLDASAPASAYPIMISQLLGPAGSLTNYEFNVTQQGTMLHGFILDETNITTIRFNYLGTDVWPSFTPSALNEVQELIQGTTVTTNRAFYLPTPVPVVPGQTKLIITSGGNVGQVIPLLSQPYSA
jgi:hypothetical protein